jgi:hypothetical protein
MSRNPNRLTGDFADRLSGGLGDSPINKTERGSERTSRRLFKSFAAEKDDGQIEIID